MPTLCHTLYHHPDSHPYIKQMAVPMADDKRADDGAQAEVDEMILDYLLYQAMKAVLDERQELGSGQRTWTGESPADVPLNMVDSFLNIFKANHPSHKIAEAIQFRLRLLRYTVLISRRLLKTSTDVPKSSLDALRARNGERAKRWLALQSSVSAKEFSKIKRAYDSHAKSFPLSSNQLKKTRQVVVKANFSNTEMEKGSTKYGTESCISLRDTLGEFMAVTGLTMENLEELSVNEAWMELAVEYMFQAVLEAFLVFGSSGAGVIEECFSWGPLNSIKGSSQDDVLVGSLFEGETEGESRAELWESLREAALQKLLPKGKVNLESHFESLAKQSPPHEFEQRLLEFLTAICEGSLPLLSQLESGSMEGFSAEEVAELREKFSL